MVVSRQKKAWGGVRARSPRSGYCATWSRSCRRLSRQPSLRTMANPSTNLSGTSSEAGRAEDTCPPEVGSALDRDPEVDEDDVTSLFDEEQRDVEQRGAGGEERGSGTSPRRVVALLPDCATVVSLTVVRDGPWWRTTVNGRQPNRAATAGKVGCRRDSGCPGPASRKPLNPHGFRGFEPSSLRCFAWSQACARHVDALLE